MMALDRVSGEPRRGSLATRIVLACVAVAGIAVLVAGVVMAGLARRSAQNVLQDSLSAQADVIASQVDERGLGSRAVGLGRVAEVVRGQGIVVVILLPRRGIQPTDQRSTQAATTAGLNDIGSTQRISSTVSVDGTDYLVEARGIGASSGFALVEPVRMASDTQRILIRNILFALGAGLLVAALAGALLGRLLGRPLRRTADVAAAMRQGRRDLRAPVEGPAEVAEVAQAVNELSVALQHSEERQREFLLSVSHELRTPLTAVHGFAESLADGVATDPRHAGQVIQQESQRLERLVRTSSTWPESAPTSSTSTWPQWTSAKPSPPAPKSGESAANARESTSAWTSHPLRQSSPPTPAESARSSTA